MPEPLPERDAAARRAFDVAASALGLAALSPLLAIAAIAVRLDSPGPALFRQERIGRGGRPFVILKFRTMRADAERAGGPLTVGADARVTRIGRWLRKSKLDELPQLVNVLRGEMSFVGPRPEVPRYVALYTPEQRRVLQARPGITDPASLAYRDENELLAARDDAERAYLEEVMPAKLRINLDYLERRSLGSDLALIAQTVRAVLEPARYARPVPDRTS